MRASVRRQAGVLEGKHLLVVGAGPLGVMTALALASNGAEVTLMGGDMSRGTGFVHAAGLVEPVATSDERAASWFKRMLDFCAGAAIDPEWGVEPRPVLFMSDNQATLEQDWLSQVASWPATDADLLGRRGGGIWFDTYVIQPNIAIRALRRELAAVGVKLHPAEISTVEFAAEYAKQRRMDAFVLATGLGLAELRDIKQYVGPAAGLTAGLGLTIRLPLAGRNLSYVIMDADALTYLIPQRDQLVCGGTNVPVPYNDELVTGRSERAKAIIADWETDVRDRVRRIWPDIGDFTNDGVVRVGARPLRNEVLTAFTEATAVPGLILGGAGGSGWTFSIGIADDACTFLCEQLGVSSPAQVQLSIGTGDDVKAA